MTIPSVLTVMDAARLLSGKSDGGMWLGELLSARGTLGAEISGYAQEWTDRISTHALRGYLVSKYGRDLLHETVDELPQARATIEQQTAEIERLCAELASCHPPAEELAPRERTSLLNIIGALLELVRTPRQGRDSDAAVIAELLDNYPEKQGIARSTLEAKFAEAKRSLRQ